MKRNGSPYRFTAAAIIVAAAMPIVAGCGSNNQLPQIPVPKAEDQVAALPAWYPERPWSAKDGQSRIYIEGKIVFDTDKATIRPPGGEKPPSSEEVLMTLQRFANEHPEVTLIRVEGHTDATASDEHNMELSARRALTVCDWLVDRGIDHTRLLAVGFGKTRPLASNANVEGRQENRRMEFHVAEVNGRPFLTKDIAAGGTSLIVKSAEERKQEREAALHPPPVVKAKHVAPEGNAVKPIDVDKAMRAQSKGEQKKDKPAESGGGG